MAMLNLIEHRFGRLEVIEIAGRNRHKQTLWRCRCDCGAVIVTSTNALRQGHTRSCGCLKVEMLQAQARTHGMSDTPTYSSWEQMIARCRNTNNERYADYGGRGITVCERWLKFENFLADMGERPSLSHSLDRVDVNGSYSPENCRWATRKQQQRNMRNSHFVEVNGQRVTVAEAVEITGIPNDVLRSRLRRGWSEQDALTRPVASKGGGK